MESAEGPGRPASGATMSGQCEGCGAVGGECYCDSGVEYIIPRAELEARLAKAIECLKMGPACLNLVGDQRYCGHMTDEHGGMYHEPECDRYRALRAECLEAANGG